MNVLPARYAIPAVRPIGRRLTALHWDYAWVVVAVAFLSVAAGGGIRSAFGVLVVAIADSFAGGRSVPSGAIALSGLMSAVAAPALGALFDRWGPRPVFGGAALMVGAGLALAAATPQVWQLYLGLGVLVGAGLAPFKPSSQGVVVAHWFANRRGLVTGVVAAGVGLGVLVLVPLTGWVLDEMGWQAGLWLLAGIFAFAISPLNALAQRHRRHDHNGGQGRTRPGAREAAVAGPTVRQAVRHWRFWVFVIGIVLGNTPLAFLIVHGVPALIDAGFAPSTAAAQVGLSGGISAVAMLVVGYLADRWNAEWVYGLGSIAMIAGIGALCAATPEQPFLLYAYVGLFAVGFASRQGLTATMAGSLLYGQSFGALVGLVTAGITVGTAIGPLLGGWIFDQTGTYQMAFVLAAISSVAALCCIWIAAPRHGSIVAAR